MSGYFTGPSIAFGPSSIEQLAALGARRALVVVDGSVAGLPRTRQAVEELMKSEARVELLPVPVGEPTISGVESLANPARAFGPDYLVAIGGGRTIDTAKALAVRLAAPSVPLDQVTPLVELGIRSRVHLVAVPTTCGSGAETTWTAELRTGEGAPVDLSSRDLTPEWALVDPTFLTTLPAATRLSTGADAIGHAIEAAVSEWANPFSDALAIHALGAGLPALVKLGKTPDDEEAMGVLQWSASQAGLAMANAPPGVGHALVRALGAEFDLPHGRLMAALLPCVVEFNYPSARDRYGALQPVFGPAAGQSRSTISERLRSVFGALGLPKTLAQAGVDADRLATRRASVIDRAIRQPGITANPRVPTKDELGQLLSAGMTGAPVLF